MVSARGHKLKISREEQNKMWPLEVDGENNSAAADRRATSPPGGRTLLRHRQQVIDFMRAGKAGDVPEHTHARLNIHRGRQVQFATFLKMSHHKANPWENRDGGKHPRVSERRRANEVSRHFYIQSFLPH